MTELIVDVTVTACPLERDRMIEEPGISQFLSQRRSITSSRRIDVLLKPIIRGLQARFRVARIRASKRGSPVARETRPRCSSAVLPAAIHAEGDGW